nr:DUF3108 domain-containing protein [Desulfobulbaceae bacterium]
MQMSAPSPPFSAGERLTFQIRWGIINAGQATLEIAQPEGDSSQDSQHFILTVKTSPAIDIFYKFRERVDSYTDSNVTKTLRYKKVQSGRTTRDIDVAFDWQNNKVQYSNFGTPLEPIDLQAGTLDPLSSLYYIRRQVTGPNILIERPVTDGKKIVIGKVHYIKQETISINGKEYDTIMLEPELKHVKGVFEKSKNSKMYIWVTNDSRKLLVKLKSKVVVGSFVAELIDYQENSAQREKNGAT